MRNLAKISTRSLQEDLYRRISTRDGEDVAWESQIGEIKIEG